MNKELSTKINQYLANLGLIYIKIHNLHWNIVGTNFKAVHEYLETLYEGFADALDNTAECLRMHDEHPLASMKDYLSVASLKEIESKQYKASEAIAIVLDDILALKQQAEETRKLADAGDHYGVIDLLEDQLANYNKTIWFLKASIA